MRWPGVTVGTHLGRQAFYLKVLAGQVLEFANQEAQHTIGGLGYARGGSVGARVEQIPHDFGMMAVGGGSEEIFAKLAATQKQ